MARKFWGGAISLCGAAGWSVKPFCPELQTYLFGAAWSYSTVIGCLLFLRYWAPGPDRLRAFSPLATSFFFYFAYGGVLAVAKGCT